MRRLKDEELANLKQEFISYLIMNGIDAEEWERIKEDDSDRAESILDDFSFRYFDIMLKGIQFATLKDEQIIHAIHFKTAECTEFVMVSKEEGQKIAHRSQSYSNSRKEYLFEKLEQGFTPDNGATFKQLALLFAKD